MKLKRLVQLFGMAALAAIVTTACPTDAGGGGSELTGTVTIEGTPAVGETLTANTIALGGSGTIFYQWFLAGDPISDATGKTYLVKAVDAGKTINVRVTRAGYSGSVTSAATAQVTAQTTALTGTVTINGSPQTGQFLTANTTALGGSGTISYQWLRGSTEISGATGSSYEVVAADIDSTISVRVTRAGYSGNVTSDPTAAVTVDNRPALSGTVSIDGTPTVGETLTANITALQGSGTISYQWLAGGESISGATASSYTVAAVDVGKTISVRVTRADNSASVTSTPTATVTDGRPALTGTVSIDGTPTVGQTLTANTTALQGSGTISYQWFWGDAEISGATESSYALTAVDEGSTIKVRVTRADNSGSVTSAATAAVADGRTPLSGIVTITGTPTVGQTLTANTTALQGSGTISYQWLHNDTEISGATALSYVLVAVDEGSTIKVRVTRADNSGSITSAATAAVSKQVTTPTTNAQHLEMLKNLGVNTTTPDLPVAPNGASYNPQTSASAANMRAVSGPERSLGPLGNIYSQPKREIFVAGYGVNGKNHALYQDFENSTLDRIGQADGDDTGWAGSTGDTSNRRKSVAADLDGDGIDEVVTVVLKNKKMLIYKGVYNGSTFTITHTQAMEHDLPETADQMLPEDTYNLPYIGWTLITADLNGDGRQECILTLPSEKNAYMYVLDNNLAITQIDLTPYYPSGVPYRWYPMVTAADYDQDGKDELCLTIGVYAVNFNASYYILKYNGAGFTKLSNNTITAGTFGMMMGRPMAGDFDGDGLPDTVFHGTRSTDYNARVVMLLQTTLNSAFQPVFTWVESASRTIPDVVNTTTFNNIIPQSAVGDVNGDRKADLAASNYLYTLNSENQFELVSDTNWMFLFPANGLHYEFAMGDVTGDQKDDVVLFAGGGIIEIYYYANGEYVRSGQMNIASTSWNETGCLPNVDKDSFILRDTGDRELLFSDPHVIAVLASAPYYAGVNEDGNGGTYFGYTKGSSSGSSNSFGFSVGMSVGFEFEDVFGIAGVEFEASVTQSLSWAQSESKDIEESWGWNNVLAQDLVVFTAIPFDVYYYEVLVPPDGAQEEKGDIITVNVPRRPHHYHMDLTDYNALVPEEHQITVNHTLGEPFTYYKPADRNTLKSQAGNRGLFSTNTQMTAGRGNQSTTISIDESTTKEDTFSYNMDVEVEAKVKAGGATVGRSVGFSYGYETTSSVSNGTSISGEVPAIPSDYYTADKDFDWGLMAFPRNGYIFVTYWTEHH